MQEHLARLRTLGARVVAASADPIDEARRSVDELGLEYPVLYGLDAEAVAKAIGAYTGERKGRAHLQPAAFVLNADRTVSYALYSSGKVGRLDAGEAAELVEGLAD